MLFFKRPYKCPICVAFLIYMLMKFDVFYFTNFYFQYWTFPFARGHCFSFFFLLILDESFVMTPCICLTNEIKLVTKKKNPSNLRLSTYFTKFTFFALQVWYTNIAFPPINTCQTRVKLEIMSRERYDMPYAIKLSTLSLSHLGMMNQDLSITR